MSAIKAADVKALRERTGAAMMDCKGALSEADGDMEKAVEILRVKGQASAAKRAGRSTSEGVVTSYIHANDKIGVLLEVQCETDFVARNEDFTRFADKITDLILRERPADLDALHALPFEGGRTVGESVTDMTGKIGEKIDVRRFEVLEAASGNRIITYIHPGAKLGVLVEMTGDGDVETPGRDVAMQVAAMNPLATTRDDVPEEVKQKELEIGREAARNEGKPDNILDRIATGKLERFYKDHVLVEQPFVKDSSMTVKDMLAKAGTDVVRYVRFGLGG